MKRLVFLIPVAVFAGLALVFYFGLFRGPPSVLPSPLIDKPAPEVGAQPIDAASAAFTRAELADGKPTIINFWASWCPPCRVEAPVLNDLGKRPGIRLYGIVYKDEPAKARGFLDELGNPFGKLNNDPDGRIAIDWGVTGAPETFVIDGKGIIRARYVGPVTERVIQEVLLPAMRP